MDWGLAFGIASLFLAIPLGIFANIMTPRWQAWWATTSTKRREKRLQTLLVHLEWLQQPGRVRDLCLSGAFLMSVSWALFAGGCLNVAIPYAGYRMRRLWRPLSDPSKIEALLSAAWVVAAVGTVLSYLLAWSAYRKFFQACYRDALITREQAEVQTLRRSLGLPEVEESACEPSQTSIR